MTETDLARGYIRVILALCVLSTVVVYLRLVARRRSTATFSADDVLVLVAWFMMLGSVINTSYSGYDHWLGLYIAHTDS